MRRIFVHKYEMIRPIGEGAAGKVYLVRDLHLDRILALKESSPEFTQREAEFLKELRHPGLPVVYDFFREGQNNYLVMEYVEGMTLRSFLSQNGKVPPGQAVKWARELCGILTYLHCTGRKIIYRDLKPENIMVRPDGSLVLIDLGAAMYYACGNKKEKLGAGTEGYCPKEQWKGGRGDVTWDIYAMGAVLYEMLTGSCPGRTTGIRLPIRAYEKSLPLSLQKIIDTCMKEKARDRYQTMEALSEALSGYDRKNIWESFLFFLLKLVKAGLLAGMALFLALPVRKGIPQSELPFPYLKGPLCLFLLWAGTAFCMELFKRQRLGIRVEKSVVLTAKRFTGLFLLLLLLFAGFGKGEQRAVYAGEAEKQLWVEMRDEEGRKLLLKEGARYPASDRIRFEIPVEALPEPEIKLRMIADGQDGRSYCSRVFWIGTEKN